MLGWAVHFVFVKGLVVIVVVIVIRRFEPLPHSAAPLVGSANFTRARLCCACEVISNNRPEFNNKKLIIRVLGRCRALRSSSSWRVVLPAPRRRHAAGRERHDLPSYVLFIAHLQSSSQGQCGCWCGHRTATAATGLKDRGSIATDISPHAGQRRVNGQGYGRAPDHGLSSSMAPKRFTTSVPC